MQIIDILQESKLCQSLSVKGEFMLRLQCCEAYYITIRRHQDKDWNYTEVSWYSLQVFPAVLITPSSLDPDIKSNTHSDYKLKPNIAEYSRLLNINVPSKLCA